MVACSVGAAWVQRGCEYRARKVRLVSHLALAWPTLDCWGRRAAHMSWNSSQSIAPSPFSSTSQVIG